MLLAVKEGFSRCQAACSDNSILDNVSKMLLDHSIAPKPSEVPYLTWMTLKDPEGLTHLS